MSRCFDVTTSTPWGRADYATRFARGITFYNTPGHGGFKLSKTLNALIPEDFRNESWAALGKQGWYEEDCDANIVIVHFPEHFSPEQVKAAHEGLQSYMPVTYAKHFPERIAEVALTTIEHAISHLLDSDATHEEINPACDYLYAAHKAIGSIGEVPFWVESEEQLNDACERLNR